MKTKLWILIRLLICTEAQTIMSTGLSAEVGATVRLPCHTIFDEAVDWRYQRDVTIDEEYICIAALGSGVTNCEANNRWPRISVISQSTPGDYTLTIYNVTLSDSGLYHCVEGGGEGTRHTNQLKVSVPKCASEPCQNNATCTEDDNWYTCVCPAGFSGTDCDSDVNECLSEPCQNGGHCFNKNNEYTCRCPPDFAGINCETVVIKDLSAKSNATVVSISVFATLGLVVSVVVVAVCMYRRRRTRRQQEPQYELERSLSSPDDADAVAPVNIIRQHYKRLLKEIDSNSSDLVKQLDTDQVITGAERDGITAIANPAERTEQLLSVLSYKSAKQFQLFIDALHKTGQQSVKFILADNNQTLSNNNLSSIDVNASTLVDLLDLEHGLLAQLQLIGCITLPQKKEIAGGSTISDKNKRLLDIVRNQSDAKYQQFIQLLQDCNQQRIARILTSNGAVTFLSVVPKRLEVGLRPLTRLLCDLYNIYGWCDVEKSELKSIKSFAFELWPVDEYCMDLMKIVLTRAVVFLFTSLCKMTSRADVIAVMTLNAVCVRWWHFITNPKLNINTHWRHTMQSIVCPYRLHPKLLFTVQNHDYRHVLRLTVLDDKLYVIYDASDTVTVYSMQQQPYTLTSHLLIDGLNAPSDIAVSNYSTCLYIASRFSDGVWKVKANHQVDKWMNVNDVRTISVATDGQITMLIGWSQLRVCSPDGKLLFIVNLSCDLVEPHHALQTANNSFIVSHGLDESKLNRVCEVNIDGVVLKSYGGSRGAGLGQLNRPVHITLDDNERILVADVDNRGVLLFNSELNIERILLTWSLDRPLCVFYNSETRQLLVGLDSGKIDVYSIQ